MTAEREAEIQAVAADFAKTRTDKSFVSGKWSVAPMNFAPEVLERVNVPTSITVSDITLSRYAQTSGIYLDRDDAKALLRAADSLRIPVMELSVWYTREEADQLREFVDLGLNAELSVMVGYIKGMSYEDQIRLAADIGLDYVTLTTGPSQSWDKAYRGKDVGSVEAAIDGRARLVAFAKSQGLKVRAAFQYPTYLPSLKFMLDLFAAQAAAGADCLLVMDHGGLSPALTRYAIEATREIAGGVPVGIHYHDSLGMAVACTVAAVEAGAELVEVTVNGVGSEGHADLAQTVISLEALYGVSTGLDLAGILGLYSLFADRSGFKLWDHKPVVGKKFFELSSDAVSRSFMIDYDPYISTTMIPEAIGGRTPFELGVQSSTGVLRRRLAQLNMTLDDEELDAVLSHVIDYIKTNRSPIDDQELTAIVNRTRSK